MAKIQGSHIDEIRLLGDRLAKTEFELERSLERLQIAQNAANFGVFEYDYARQTVWWSDSMYVLYGRPDFDHRVETWRSYIHPDDRAPILEKMAISARTLTDLVLDYRIILPDQSIRWIGHRSQFIVEPATGKLLRTVGANIDITDRKARELQDELLAQTVRNADSPILVKDLNGIILYWNYACEQLYGWKEREVVGSSVKVIFKRPEELDEIMNSVKTGERVELNVDRVTKDGQDVKVHIVVSPIYDKRGHLIGASTIAHPLEN